MQNKLFLFVISLLLLSCSEKEIDFNLLVERNRLMYEVNSDSPFSGKVFQKYGNGQFQMTGHYEKGLKTGEWFSYYNNGQVKIKQNFHQNKLNGIYESYSENGTPILKTNYLEGKYDGNYKEYNRQNILIKDINYKAGNFDGGYMNFNDKGTLIVQTNYKNGLIDGKYTNFYENGNKKLTYFKKNKIYIDDYIEFNVDGTIKSHSFYKNNTKINRGTWRKYWSADWKILDEPSKFYSTVSFDQQGNVSSKVKYFYQESGKIHSDHTYKTIEPDLREGISIWYSDNGNVIMKGNYIDNKRSGKWETFYETKNTLGTFLKESATYSEGKINGLYTFIGNPNETVWNVSKGLIPNDKGYWLVSYKPQTDYGYWKLEGYLTNHKLDETWKIWLLRASKNCYYKIDIYSTAIWKQGREIENSYHNLHRGRGFSRVYNKNGNRFTYFWGDYAKKVIASSQPYFCR